MINKIFGSKMAKANYRVQADIKICFNCEHAEYEGQLLCKKYNVNVSIRGICKRWELLEDG